MTVEDEEYGKKRPIPPRWIGRIDTFICLYWRLVLFVVLMLFLLFAGFVMPPEDMDFPEDHWR